MTIYDQKFADTSANAARLSTAIKENNFKGTLSEPQYTALSNGVIDILEAVGQTALLPELKAIIPGVKNQAVLMLPGRYDVTVSVEGGLLPGAVDTKFIVTTTREDSAIMSFSAHLVQDEMTRRPKSLIVNILTNEDKRSALNKTKFTTILLSGDSMRIQAKTTVLHGSEVEHPACLQMLNDLSLDNAAQVLGEITTSLLTKPQK